MDKAVALYDNYMEQNPEYEEKEEDKDDDDKNESMQPRIKPVWKLDPSGFVYEVHEGNRVQGVTATVLFREDPNDTWEVWDSEWWGEVNPQNADMFGRYGWDVLKGYWRDVYEKDGYETAYSEDTYGPIEVPPTGPIAPEYLDSETRFPTIDVLPFPSIIGYCKWNWVLMPTS